MHTAHFPRPSASSFVARIGVAALTGLFAFDLGTARADAPPEAERSDARTAQENFSNTLSVRTGAITLPNDLATISLAPDWAFLGPEDTERVLTQAWSNPPGSGALGMMYRPEIGLFSERSWAVIVTYSEDGYVSDDDANGIDYDALLAEMKESSAEASRARSEAGFGTLELVGWAEPPRYDASTHKLFWAKELRSEGSADNTLNYSIRVLGRQGVLELNAVARLSEIERVRHAMPSVLGFVEFNPGKRYEDYVEGTDTLAAYGLGALVAGKMATQVGFWKGLLAVLLAGKKLVVVALVGAVAALRSWFGKRKAASDDDSKEPDAPSDGDSTSLT